MDILITVLGLLTEPWVLLVLAASVMFAFGNHIDEELLKKHNQPVGVLVVISGLFGFMLMGIFSLIAWSLDTSVLLPWNTAFQAIGIGVLEMVWVVPYLYATRRRGAVIVGPLLQVIPVIALLFEAMVGVIPPMLQAVGALTIVAGGILLSLEKEEAEDGSTSHNIDWVTVSLMILASTVIALIYVLFKDVVGDDANYVAVGFWSALGIALTGVAIYVFWKPYQTDFNAFCRNVSGEKVRLQLFNELMDQGGAYLVHLANVIGGQLGVAVGVVTAFNATQPIAIIVVGALFFGTRQEIDGLRGWFIALGAIGLIAAGTIMVALG